MIKYLRIFTIVFCVSILGFAIGAFTVFTNSLKIVQEEIIFYPSRQFPIYILEQQSVSIEFKNILLIAVFISLLLSTILFFLGEKIKRQLKKTGVK